MLVLPRRMLVLPTWTHDSILHFLANILKTADDCDIFADLAGFKNPTIVTGDAYRPDLLLTPGDQGGPH